MPRTFSLARLLFAITLFCLLCGLAVNYPEDTIALAISAAVFAPFIAVWLSLVRYSRRPVTLLIACSVGAVIGPTVFFLAMLYSASSLGFSWTGSAGIVGYLLIGAAPTIGALATGGPLILYELRHMRAES